MIPVGRLGPNVSKFFHAFTVVKKTPLLLVKGTSEVGKRKSHDMRNLPNPLC